MVRIETSDQDINQPTLRPIWWQPGEKRSFLKALASWLPLDPYPLDVFRQNLWEDPDFDPELCLVLEAAGHWLGFGMGIVRQSESQEKSGFIKLLAVAPEVRGNGWGYKLVTALENRLFDRGVKAIRLGESAPFYVSPGLDPRYTRALLLFEKMDYRQIGHCFNLRVDLNQDQQFFDECLGSRNQLIQRARQDDIAGVSQMLKSVWPGWYSEVMSGFKKARPTVFLAWDQGELAGFAAYECQNRGTGWFGPMGTLPQARGRGIGRALCTRVLGAMNAEGFQEAIIPWVGPVGFYQKAAGAEIHRIFFRMQKDRPEPLS